ncbi:lytic murein transglycosylase [Chthonobacter albigriseus]|uniref:lytic murein transglycosylase n=1 Tax=Chthonobacter albigriseus TaxID=1683161 RepID=UPI0015EF6FAA|nr:lytic murein transglycosylase [Chthonobacter albigriseus]
MTRPIIVLFLILSLTLASGSRAAGTRSAVEDAFRVWLAETAAPAAAAGGVDAGFFASAVADLTLDWSLPGLVPPGTAAAEAAPEWQAEFRSPGRYFDEKRLAALARDGRRELAGSARLFREVEAKFGVPAAIVAAVWARESDFGRAPIKYDALRTLATQAFMGRRSDIYLDEFVALLRVMAEDGLPRSLLRSSWAGALGQPQFLPTKLETHAVDFDGDGRRDIWRSDADIAGSIAHYLRDFGWVPGVGVAVEVAVPAGVSCTLEGPDKGRGLGDWAAMGVTAADGAPLRADALGSGSPKGHLLMPAGRKGPAFLVSENFYVLKRYNESDLYALFIGHLADRMGDPAARIAGPWRAVDGLTRRDVRDLQIALQKRGYDTGGADGLAGWRTRVAIGSAEAAAGRPPTCFPGRGFSL